MWILSCDHIRGDSFGSELDGRSRKCDGPRIEAWSVEFARPAVALRDHRAGLPIDAGVEHGIPNAKPFRWNAGELKVAVGQEGKASRQFPAAYCGQDGGGGEKAASRPLKKSADRRRLLPARTGSEIANFGLDDPAAAVELAVRRCAHAAANSFGSRVRL
jgi:hypothetical protein